MFIKYINPNPNVNKHPVRPNPDAGKYPLKMKKPRPAYVAERADLVMTLIENIKADLPKLDAMGAYEFNFCAGVDIIIKNYCANPHGFSIFERHRNTLQAHYQYDLNRDGMNPAAMKLSDHVIPNTMYNKDTDTEFGRSRSQMFSMIEMKPNTVLVIEPGEWHLSQKFSLSDKEHRLTELIVNVQPGFQAFPVSYERIQVLKGNLQAFAKEHKVQTMGEHFKKL